MASIGREVREVLDYWRRGLEACAARRGDRIVQRRHQKWIAFRSAQQRRVFAEVRPSRRRIQVFLLPSIHELRDPLRIARAAPHSQGWSWFRTKLTVVGNGHARAALALLEQSYEKGPSRGKARRVRAGSRGRQTRLSLAAT